MKDPETAFPNPKEVDISSDSSSSSTEDTEQTVDPPSQDEHPVKEEPFAEKPAVKRAESPPPLPRSFSHSNQSTSPKLSKAKMPKRATSAGHVIMAMLDEFERDLTRNNKWNMNRSTKESANTSKSFSSVVLAPSSPFHSNEKSPTTDIEPSKDNKVENIESGRTTPSSISGQSDFVATDGDEDEDQASCTSRAINGEQNSVAKQSLQNLNKEDDDNTGLAVQRYEDKEDDDEEKQRLSFRTRQMIVKNVQRPTSPPQSSAADAQLQQHEATMQDDQLDYGEPVKDGKVTPTTNDAKVSLMQRKKMWLCICCLLVFLALGGAGAAVYMLIFVEQRDANALEPSLAPTISPAPTPAPSSAPISTPSATPSASPTVTPQPSDAPSSSPTRDFRRDLENFLWGEYAIDVSAQDPNSPASLAADWILQELHDSEVSSISLSTELLQRFALVTMEISLQEDIDTAKRQLRVPTIATKNVKECEWKGVKCNDAGEVIKIDWSHQDGWRGNIPSEIRLFSSLRHLDLSNNRIGGKIPEELYALADLTHLYLYQNRLSGTISTKIGRLDKLVRFHLSHNSLSGSIPQEIKSDSGSVDGVRPLEYFNVYLNQLTGTIPNELRWRRCQYFDVGRNDMTGRLPNDLGRDFASLRHLHLDYNNFRGTLPTSYNNVGNGRLESLTINHNVLTGVVSGDRRWYNKLVQFTLQENQFTSLEPENCNMLIPRGEMPELKADCNICECGDFFNICRRYCDNFTPAPTIPPPTNAPVPAPTNAPVPPPTNAPVPPPTNAPVPDPTNAPVPAPTNAPVPPTNAPVPAPTNAPIPPPTNAPTPPPSPVGFVSIGV